MSHIITYFIYSQNMYIIISYECIYLIFSYGLCGKLINMGIIKNALTYAIYII